MTSIQSLAGLHSGHLDHGIGCQFTWVADRCNRITNSRGLIISNMMGYAMMIVCDVSFPLSALPPAVQWIGNILPVTHGLQAVRMILKDRSYIPVAPRSVWNYGLQWCIALLPG